jgi:outer membrane protein TolC
MNLPIRKALLVVGCWLFALSCEAGPESIGATPSAVTNNKQPTTNNAFPSISGLLTIDRAVEIALRESPVVRGAVEEVNVAVEELRAARAQRRPILSTTAFLSGGSNANIAATPDPVMPRMLMGLPRGAFYDQNVSLMAPLYTGGRLEALVRRARAARDASAADLAEVKLEVALLTRVAYRTAQARAQFLEVYRDLVRTNEERLRISTVSFREGRLPRYPVLRDETELANAKQELTNVERDREIAMLQLRTVMGVRFAPDVVLEAPPVKAVPSSKLQAPSDGRGPAPDNELPQSQPGAWSLEPGAASEASLDQLIALAEQRRPLLQAQQLRVQSAQHGIDVARSTYRPQVSLFAMGDAMQGRGMDPFRGYTAGIAIALPILDGGMRRAELRRTEAEQRRAEAERERLRLQVSQEVTSNWLALQAAERNIATAQAAVRSSEEDYRIAQLRYQEGKSINVEALDALVARTRARVNLTQAIFDYQIAADQLRRSIGLP